MPDHALDSLLVAEADSAIEAHAFATSKKQFEAQIDAGEFVPLPLCCVPTCPNLCAPARRGCILHPGEHSEPAQAGEFNS